MSTSAIPQLTTPPSTWRGRFIALAGIILTALTMRIPVSAVSPIMDIVADEVGLSPAMVGLLGAIPLFAFALFGVLTPVVARRLGMEWTLIVALSVTSIGEVARALSSSSTGFLVWTGVALAGVGAGNVLLPPLAKRYFPDRVGAITAAFAVTMGLSAALPPLLMVSWTQAWGWRLALGCWAVLGIFAVIPWLIILVQSLMTRRKVEPVLAYAPSAHEPGEARPAGQVWRSPMAWGIAVMFAMNSWNFFVILAWLPKILTDAGLDQQSASQLLGVFALIGIPMALTIPPLTTLLKRPFVLVVILSAMMVVAYGGLLVAAADYALLWVVCAGIGSGLFPMVMALLNLRSATAAGAVALSGFVQPFAFLVAGLGPILVGRLYSVSGTWTSTFGLLMATVVVMMLSGILACRPGVVEDSWLGSEENRL